MGILEKIFGKKPQAILAQMGQNKVAAPLPQLMPHPDIADLLWFADGANRNYYKQETKESYVVDGIRFTISVSGSEEPSAIRLSLPVALPPHAQNAEKLPYYPSYSQMSPAQRGTYLTFLQNPYNPNIDIGYVFVLYYGLERQLLCGNYEKAYQVIIKLRDVHQNNSFQSYSGNALILTSLYHQRGDLLGMLMASIDKKYELKFSDNLFLLGKASLGIPLEAQDMMRMAKSFEFENLGYIKKYPNLFETALKQLILDKFGTDSFMISNMLSTVDKKKLSLQEVSVYANTSIIDKTMKVPRLIDCFKLKKLVHEMLCKAHEQVKVQLVQMRKSGLVPAAAPQSNLATPKKELVFDERRERELLAQYRTAKNQVDRHFAIIGMIEFYYKYRELDSQHIKRCEELCLEDISGLQKLQTDYCEGEKENIMKMAKYHTKVETQKALNGVGPFIGDIPAFSRLAILYEKQKEYAKVIEICDQAICYYSFIGMHVAAESFEERKAKAITKC